MNPNELMIRTFRHTPSPEIIANTARWQRNYLTFQQPEELEQYHPGFTSGDIFEKHYDPSKWVPKPDLIDSIQYAGTGNPVGLNRYLVQRLTDFNRFQIHLRHKIGDKNEWVPIPETQVMNMQRIFETKKFIEDFMQHKNRRSGEPVICHIHRTVLNVLDTLHAINKMYYRGQLISPVNARIAETAIIVALLHDFDEDEVYDPIKREYRSGEIVSYFGSKHPEQDGLKFIQKRSLREGQPEDEKEVIDVLRFDVSQYDAAEYYTLLNSLNTDQEGVDMYESIINGMNSVDEHQRFEYLLRLVGLLVKFADRRDNLATIGFTSENGLIIPESKDRVKRKAIETLNIFAPLEHQVLRLTGQDWSESIMGRSGLGSNFSDNVIHFISDADFAIKDYPLYEMLPTRVARLMLMGLNPNQIYHAPPLTGEGMPRTI